MKHGGQGRTGSALPTTPPPHNFPLPRASTTGAAACGEWGRGQSYTGANHGMELVGKTVVLLVESAAIQRPPTLGAWRGGSPAGLSGQPQRAQSMLGAGASDRILNGLTRSTSKYGFSDFGSRLPLCPAPPPHLFWTRPHPILVECCVS